MLHGASYCPCFRGYVLQGASYCPCFRGYVLHGAKNNLTLRIRTDAVTDGTDAMGFYSGLCFGILFWSLCGILFCSLLDSFLFSVLGLFSVLCLGFFSVLSWILFCSLFWDSFLVSVLDSFLFSVLDSFLVSVLDSFLVSVLDSFLVFEVFFCFSIVFLTSLSLSLSKNKAPGISSLVIFSSTDNKGYFFRKIVIQSRGLENLFSGVC